MKAAGNTPSWNSDSSKSPCGSTLRLRLLLPAARRAQTATSAVVRLADAAFLASHVCSCANELLREFFMLLTTKKRRTSKRMC